MPRRAVLPVPCVFAVLLATACGGGTRVVVTATVADVTVTVEKGQPVRCTWKVPTGGHELAVDGARADGDTAVVMLTLTSPAADEATTQAEAVLAVERPWAEVVHAGARHVRVEARRVQRGAAYLVPPAYELLVAVGIPE